MLWQTTGFHSPESISHLYKDENLKIKQNRFFFRRVLTPWQQNKTCLQLSVHNVSVGQHFVALLEK